MLHPYQQGDLYEANFCMEFYAENAIIDPLDKFLKLNEISQPPFAVFLKQPPILLSASPSGT
jgi:para-aminobenzoate synthetase component 1